MESQQSPVNESKFVGGPQAQAQIPGYKQGVASGYSGGNSRPAGTHSLPFPQGVAPTTADSNSIPEWQQPIVTGNDAAISHPRARKPRRVIPPLNPNIVEMLKTNGYNVTSILGQGAFGTVYKAQLVRPSALAQPQTELVYVAIKCIPIKDGVTVPFTTYREIALLKELKHATIMRLYEVYVRLKSPSYICIVCEYLDQDLAKRIAAASPQGGLPLLTIKVSFCLCCGYDTSSFFLKSSFCSFFFSFFFFPFLFLCLYLRLSE